MAALSTLRQRDIDDGYDNIQSYYNGAVNTNSATKQPMTKTDKQFDAAMLLFNTASRFRNAVAALEECCAVFRDPESKPTAIRNKVNQIKKFIIPLIDLSSDNIDATAKELSPIASTKYVHDRRETVRKEQVDKCNKRMGADIQLIHNFVNSEKAKKSNTSAPPNKKQRMKRSARSTSTSTSNHATTLKNAESLEYPLPQPASGKAFSKPEIVNIVGETEKGSKKRAKCIKAIVDHQSRNGIDCKYQTITRLMRRSAEVSVDCAYYGFGN